MSDLASHPSPVPASAAPAPGPTVLFVDDEPAILGALRRVARRIECRILVAEGGPQALALLETEAVDVIVSDMRMPGMDGAQFLEKAAAVRPAAQRLLLTGYADIESTIAAVNRGRIHRYLAKPWDDADLLDALRDGLERRRLENENARLQALTAAQNDELRTANATLKNRVKARTAELDQLNGMLEASYAELEHNFLVAMDVFAGLLELRQREAAGRSRRVAHRARAIAQRLGLPPRDVQDVHVAGLLHAIGTLSLPDELVERPLATLNADERAKWLRHPVVGESVLLPMPALQRVARLVRLQCERLDGQGTPDGLHGDQLPVAARVLAAAIDYEGLLAGTLSERRHSADDATKLMLAAAASHYGEEVVAALVRTRDTIGRPVVSELQLTAGQLRPGMVLSRDLLTERGTLLLPAGRELTEHAVDAVQELVARQSLDLVFHVKSEAALKAEAAAAAFP